jgi:diketogulonate reductase-like aldo/keto reductase
MMSAPPTFNYESKTVRLNSGYDMPLVGLGTYSLHGDVCVRSVKAFLKHGGRLIDTAYLYGNEQEVGEGIRQAIKEYSIAREEVFVVTKLYPNQFAQARQAITLAHDKLDIGYIDMFLLHHPGDNDTAAYRAMEKFVEQGTIRSVGLSNWYREELTDFLPKTRIAPAVVQNEIHPYYQERSVVPFIQEKGIVPQAWYPLGGRGHTRQLLSDDTITSIAHTHGLSPAQVVVRWNLQRGIVPVLGSSNLDHMKENLDVFHSELSDDDMQRIATLNRNEKHDWY